MARGCVMLHPFLLLDMIAPCALACAVTHGDARPTSCVSSPRLLQFVKAGFAADNLPRWQFPSIVGRPMLRAEEEALGEVRALQARRRRRRRRRRLQLRAHAAAPTTPTAWRLSRLSAPRRSS